jgi:hypothetical protein
MVDHDMEDIFKKKYSFLITNVTADGNPVDIFVDVKGTI